MAPMKSWGLASSGFAILVHGGAGKRARREHKAHVDGCAAAADAAAAILTRGGSALDAAQRAVEVLEDDPRFNAGTGAVLTSEGTLELDACVMDGSDLRVGGVCCLPAYNNPIAVARAVLEDGRHVLYAGAGADAFARQAGFVPADPSTMITDEARAKLARQCDTVGAVARDRRGHLAAATSTGGLMGKRPGRVGDSPLVGAGTYADDLAGAASATGIGESIIRVGLCLAAVARLTAGEPADQAAASELERMRKRTGSDGGLILLSRSGDLGIAHSTKTMPWAARWAGGEARDD